MEQPPGHPDFDAAAFEHLLRRAGLHGHAVTIGCVLTGYALPDGCLDRVLTVGQLVAATGLDRSHVTITLRQMQRQGWIARPEHTDSRDTRPRPITLTIPTRLQEPTS
jgi:DNA-binding transcriptional regulator GbsR (MarR family)